MGARIETVVAALGAARLAADAEAFGRISALDDRLDRAQAELADYLASLRRKAMGAEDVATAQTILTAATELEAVGDLLAERLPELVLRWRREGAPPRKHLADFHGMPSRADACTGFRELCAPGPDNTARLREAAYGRDPCDQTEVPAGPGDPVTDQQARA